jgi:Xaa-Pro aminopeptidase
MAEAVAISWDDQRVKRERIAHLQAEMQRRGVGALFLDDGPNARYVLNLKIPGASVFVPPRGEPLAFVRPRDMGYVKRQHAKVQLPYYSRAFTWDGGVNPKVEEFAAGIADLMAEYGVSGEPLGVDVLSPAAYNALARQGITVDEALPVVEMARSVKTPDEVAIYRAIGQQYAHTVRAFRDALRPGITENELAEVVVSAWYEAGGEEVSQLNVCAGENMNPWRRWPTQRPLQEGEFAGIDLHGRAAGGLRGDSSRTFFVGDNPTALQRDLYRRAYDYLKGAADAFQAGRSYAEAMAAVPAVPERFQPQLDNYSIAHCIGMTPSGYPAVDRDKPPLDDVLKPNQVLAIECYFGEEGSPLAVKLEEMVLLRDGPPELLGAAIPFDERWL